MSNFIDQNPPSKWAIQMSLVNGRREYMFINADELEDFQKIIETLKQRFKATIIKTINGPYSDIAYLSVMHMPLTFVYDSMSGVIFYSDCLEHEAELATLAVELTKILNADTGRIGN
jgi:hypothetical protein